MANKTKPKPGHSPIRREVAALLASLAANKDLTVNGKRLDPAAIVPKDLAALFAKLTGRQITAEMIQADITAGAPTNRDGSINLVHYAAWLVKELPRVAGSPPTASD